MIQKLRDKLYGLHSLSTDERGSLSFLQMAALIIGPIVAATIAMGAVTSLRLGGDLAGAFTRDAQMNQMVERLQLQLSNITAMNVEDDQAFTAQDQPSKRTAFYVPSSGMPDVCVSNAWSLEEEGSGTLTLRNITYTHSDDSCDSDIASQTEKIMTGLSAETVFQYENAYGRDLTFVGGAEAGTKASVNERPEGLFNNEWDYASPGFVTLAGQMNQVLGSTPLKYTAKTTLKQLRPGMVGSDLGDLGPPLIERIARGGDIYRAQMSALTVLEDPRTVIEWSWREVKNAGDTPTSLPTETQWAAWSAWSTLDHFDSTVLQGSKWQVQAKYRVVLEERSAESENVTMTWVRPIDKPAAPTVAIALDPATGNATTTVTPAVCTAGTTAHAQIRTSVNKGVWSAWAVRTGKPFTLVSPVGEGARIAANGQARCVTKYTESEWADGASAPEQVRPITSVPKIDSVDATVPVPDDRGTGQGVISACPAGTTYQVRWRYQVNAGAWAYTSIAFADSNTRPTVNAAGVREGERFTVQLVARCISPNVTTAPTAERTSDPVVNPIRTVPRITNVVASVNSASGVPTVRGNVGSCQPWMTYQGRALSAVNSSTSYSTNGSLAAISTTPSWNLSAINQGARFRGGIEARCVTTYANGASVRATNDAWQIRPIVTPATPTITATISNGTGTSTITAAICPAGTTLAYNHRQRTSQQAMGSWSSYTDARIRTITVGEGGRFEAEGQTRCFSPYTTSSWSRSASASTVRAIGTPGQPTIQARISGSNGISTLTQLDRCAAGASPQFRQQRDVRTTKRDLAFGEWAYNQVVTASVGEGARLDVRGGVRCITQWAQSGWSGTAATNTIRAISDTPTVRNVTGAVESSTPVVRADLGSCAAPLTYEARMRKLTNASTIFGQGAWTPFAKSERVKLSGTALNQGDRYRGGMTARCVTSWAKGPEVTADDGSWRVNPITGRLLIDRPVFYSAGSEGHLWANITAYCPAGTAPSWRGLMSKDYEPLWTTWAGWVKGTYPNKIGWNAGGMNEGQRFAGAFMTKCTSPYAEGPEFGSSTNGYTVRPITTVPTASTWTGWGTVYFNNPSACPAGTTFRWRYADRPNWDRWSSWSHEGGTRTWFTAGNQGGFEPRSGWAPYGGSLESVAQVLCRSDFTNGPSRDYVSRSGTRPYPAPSEPGAPATSGGVWRSCDNSLFGVSFYWGGGGYASSYEYYVSWTDWSGGRSSSGVYSTSNTWAGFSHYGSHSTSLGVAAYVRSVNSSGVSGWSGGYLWQGSGCTTG